MDLIAFIQASTVKSPSESSKSSNNLKSNDNGFANIMEKIAKLDFDGELMDANDMESLSLEDMENVLLNIFNELDIDVENVSELDLNIVAQLLMEFTGKGLSEKEVELTSNKLDAILNSENMKHGSSQNVVQLEEPIELSDKTTNSFTELLGTETSSDEKEGKKTFLNELVKLLQDGSNGEEIKKFLSDHAEVIKTLLKENNFNRKNSDDSLNAMLPNKESHSEITNEQDYVKAPVMESSAEKVPLTVLKSVDDLTESTQYEALQKETNARSEVTAEKINPIHQSILQSATFNEGKLKGVDEKNQNISEQNVAFTEKAHIDQALTGQSMGDGSFDENSKQDNPETIFKNVQEPKNETIKPMYAEGGFDTAISKHSFSTEVKTEFGQITVDPLLNAKSIEQTTKTEVMRYTTPVEFVDQLNGIITKHSKGLDGIEKISVQIYPKELGRIDLDLNMQHHRLSVDFTVSNDRVKEIVETNFVGLADQLDLKGVQVDKLEAKTEKQQQQERQSNNGNKPKQQNHQENNQESHQRQKRQLGYNTFEYTA